MRPQPQFPKKKRSGILRSEVFSLRYQQHGVPMGIKIAQKLYLYGLWSQKPKIDP